MKSIVLGVALALAPMAAVAADQFDLVCTGKEGTSPEDEKPWQFRIAVDLGRRAFCPNNCGQVSEIARIEPGRIVFWDGPITNRMDVNRADGKIYKANNGFYATGTCTAAPFTPMPANRF